ncbi:hypothetical protein Tco_0259236, partial [Tanacetum coccineum]
DTCPQQFAAATYSALVVKVATMVCFLHCHEISLCPTTYCGFPVKVGPTIITIGECFQVKGIEMRFSFFDFVEDVLDSTFSSGIVTAKGTTISSTSSSFSSKALEFRVCEVPALLVISEVPACGLA